MRTEKVSNKLVFRSGLTPKLVSQCNSMNIQRFETNLRSNRIDANFRLSKMNAFAVKKIMELFDYFRAKSGTKLFNVVVPSITSYMPDELVFKFVGGGFCVPETRKIIKEKEPFKTGAVLYEERDDIENLNEQLDISFAKNERSSSHYLSPFIHEYMHKAYIDYIYRTHGYEGSCVYTKDFYRNDIEKKNGLAIMRELATKTFTDKENEIIKDNIGNYATGKQNQYHEVFAETFTKIICDSLSEDGIPNKNPFDLLKKLPPEFLSLLDKVFV